MAVLKLTSSFFLWFACIFGLTACVSDKKPKSLLITGAGASFPYILYSKWLSEYHKVDRSVAINYQSIGSGGGIRQFVKGTLDFGGTDIPVSPEEIRSSKKEILHIPTVLGAVAITYNLDLDTKKTLRLDGLTLSLIFRGKIKNWSDPLIQKLNPEIHFPKRDIVVVYRADGSGTTSFFTDYLSLISKDFLKEVGKGKSVPWPVGVGGKGNEGVMGLVHKMKGAIAYIGASYAVSQKLPVVAVKNPAGQFVQPTLKSVRASADQAMKSKKSYTASLINMKGKDSYPLSGFTYIIISKKMPRKKGRALVDFLKWSLGPGQKFAESLFFIPLPQAVTNSALKTLAQIEME